MTQDIKPGVGFRLRTFRERQGWSLRTLAERCGLSINAISRIERGENSPTVSSLNRLANALAVPITDFFTDIPERNAILVKQGQGLRVSNSGFIAEQLGMGLPGQQLDPFILSIEPEHQHDGLPINHPGEEFVFCLEGGIEYSVGEKIFALEAGDSLLFEGMHPHYWRNHLSVPAVILLVFQAARDNSIARQSHYTG